MTTEDSTTYSVLSDEEIFSRWFGVMLAVSASELLAPVIEQVIEQGGGKGGRRGGVYVSVVSYSCSLFCCGFVMVMLCCVYVNDWSYGVCSHVVLLLACL